MKSSTGIGQAALASLLCLAWATAPVAQAPDHGHHGGSGHENTVDHEDHSAHAAGRADTQRAADCAAETRSGESEGARHYVVFAGRAGDFYDGSGPSLVALVKADEASGETETGAVGLYAGDANQVTFGAIPPHIYDPLLEAADHGLGAVVLRLEVRAPQYERVLAVMRNWDRRARSRELLYQDNVVMNQILFLKQASETLNLCTTAIDLYVLDQGGSDYISKRNEDGHEALIPVQFVEELRRRNDALHVPNEALPKDLLLLGGGSPTGWRP